MYPNSVEKRNKTIMNCFRDRNGSRKDLTDPQNYSETFRKYPLTKSSSQKRIIYQCDGSCVQQIQELSRKVSFLEKQHSDDKTYRKDLEERIIELTKKLDRSQQSSTRSEELVRNPNIPSTKMGRTMRKLANWCNNRPTIEALKKNNIFQDEPCFDTELENTLKHEVFTTIPKIVVDCVDLIESQFKASSYPIEGLYRASGDYTKIQALRFSIDSNDYDSLKSVTNIHTLTGVLKLFLREIKSPLVKTNEIKTFIGPSNKWMLQTMTKKVEILQNLVKTLPECNRDTMNYLFSHFHRLTKVPLQNVSSEVLAISITPSILHTASRELQPQDLLIVLKETEVFADCLGLMIDHSTKIFGTRIDDRSRRRNGKCSSFRRSLSQPCLVVSKVFSSV
ncbi:WW domain-containing protein tag-325 [Episyrphus balteatus]|uniref:WW domain-containing protein tag-325 n=1 Tax=Episyrphus balteatus TaxID=286459 RepID=UPI002485D841|nr:WW domain-containing protein tag-325 [Episyrphus balteatus]